MRVLRAGPGISVQDLGRSGTLGQGLSRGGALDPVALVEGAVLLGQDAGLAALEIVGSFLTIEATSPVRIALTGTPMRATLDGAAVAWNASHTLPKAVRLDLSASPGGVSYLHLGGGIDAPQLLGSRSAHLTAGIGRMVAAGDTFPAGKDQGTRTGLTVTPLPRFDGGLLRLVETPQTALFSPAQRARFVETLFTKDTRANRMGQKLHHSGPGFACEGGLQVLSDTIVPGDIQITGDGAPFVLLAECQTTGGYPRIGTVLPCDLPRLVQAPAGAALRFAFVSFDEADAIEQGHATKLRALRDSLRPLIRDPRDMADLLAHQLVSGVTCGDDLERDRP
ncbi:MAG: biotin-dependent carboxyltransferase family protein [Roseinatronobacter sp.]